MPVADGFGAIMWMLSLILVMMAIKGTMDVLERRDKRKRKELKQKKKGEK